ncbi:MAG TPA: hypothetical protein VNA20_03600 [Frankiaceae bacterium]|nr:hypothetical protein [Frankiaceae bacterium]
MTDLRTALARAAGDGAADRYDVEADLARGRRALRRQRTARGAGTLVLVTAAAGVVRVAAPDADPPRAAAPSPSPVPSVVSPSAGVTTPPPATRLPRVRLVAYTGRQPSGYQVAYLPDGWEVQGADPFAMTIADKDDPDRHPASFEGKLVVMLRSSSDTGRPVGKAIPVGKGTGYLNRQEDTAVLTYRDERGHWVQVQVPPVLGWSDAEIAKFGAGVVVTRNAQPGVG